MNDSHKMWISSRGPASITDTRYDRFDQPVNDQVNTTLGAEKASGLGRRRRLDDRGVHH